MADCDVCGTGPGKYGYTCNACGGEHCSDHRLPEHHDCPGLADADDGERVMDPARSSARQRREVVREGGVASSSAGSGRPWLYYALAALALLGVAGLAVALVGGI